MNNKKTHLLYLDITVDDDEIGRVIIEPVSFDKNCIFLRYFCQKTETFADPIAVVTQVRLKHYVKFAWSADYDNHPDEEVAMNGESSSGVFDVELKPPCDYAFYKELQHGVVLQNHSGQEFFVLTKKYDPVENFGGEIVGRVFKGMSIVGHLSSLQCNSKGQVLKTCAVKETGIIAPGASLGLKRRDALLDQYPGLPQDAENVNFADVDRILNIAYTIKRSGNVLFRQEKYEMAMFRFNKAVKYLSYCLEKQKITTEQEDRLLALAVSCMLNSAACKIKTQDFDGALQLCDEALEHSPSNCPNNFKIFYRRGQAYHGQMNYELSLKDLYAALRWAPNDKAVKNEIAAVEGEMQVYTKGKEAKPVVRF